MPPHPQYCSCCHTGSYQSAWALIRTLISVLLSTSWIMKSTKTSTKTPEASDNHGNNSLTGPTASASAAVSVQNTSATVPNQAPANHANVQPQISVQAPNTTPTTLLVPSQRILFAIQGSKWSLGLEEIPVSRLLNDPEFFRILKARYKKHRNLVRRLISPFRFRYCRFVKVT
jgi:hypothetical protein